MQKLNVRFTDETKNSISALAIKSDYTDSSIARAALNIGIKSINEQMNNKIEPKLFFDWIEDNQTA